jgi:type IV pilus assembly protein PilY1
VGETVTPNGLADPFAADAIGADSIVDFVYAGDLRGNLWKFDVRSASAADWKSSSKRLKLFTAKDASGNPQPITTQPEGTLHPSGKGFMITFGTGKYIEQNDLKSSTWTTQSFYGIWDKNDGTAIANRTQLVQQDIAVENTGSTTYRTLTARPVDSTKFGWFIDFPIAGERSVFRPLLLKGRLIFTTLVPSVNPCDFGGSSYLMIVNPATGGRIDAPVLDANGDGVLDASDKIGAMGVYASGVQSKVGILPTPAIVLGGIYPGNPSGAGNQIYGTSGPLLEGTALLIAFAIGGGSNGLATTLLGLAASSGRVTWREVLAR